MYGTAVSGRNQAGSTLIGKEGVPPFEQHAQPVSEPGQVEDVDEQPGPPGEPSRQVQASDEGDGAITANRRKVSLVDVPERQGVAAIDSEENVPRGPHAGLNRRRR